LVEWPWLEGLYAG